MVIRILLTCYVAELVVSERYSYLPSYGDTVSLFIRDRKLQES